MNPYVMLKLINENDLTIEQFYCGYLIHLSKEKVTEVNKEFEIYFNKHSQDINFLGNVDLLEEKGFIKNGNVEPDVYRFENIQILDKFTSLLIVEKDLAWREVLEVYPMYGYINDKKIFLQKHDDKLKNYYFNNILKGGDVRQHEKFLVILDYYFQDKVEQSSTLKTLHYSEQCMSLANFLHSWDSISKIIMDEINNN